MEKLSVQALNALFACFDQHPSAILWVRSKDYQRQIYIGPNFEKVWKRPVDLIYTNPDSWNSFLYNDDKHHIIQEINNRITSPDQTNSKLLYRILDSSNNINYIMDEVFMLINENNQHVGYMGYSIIMSDIEWHDIYNKGVLSEDDHQQNKMRKDLVNVIKKELKVDAISISYNENKQPVTENSLIDTNKIILRNKGKPITLTPREAECIAYLIAGKTAKQTAAALKISPRTVLFHLDNMRQKTDSKTKLELLGKMVVME
jgi:DNA-binding CsgD family transcriptional regulator